VKTVSLPWLLRPDFFNNPEVFDFKGDSILFKCFLLRLTVNRNDGVTGDFFINLLIFNLM
jgi:hypothetical protein